MMARVCLITRRRQLMIFWWGTLIAVTSAAAPSSNATIDAKEVEKFMAQEWWEGEPRAGLRALNALRVPFVKDGLLSVAGTRKKKYLPLEGYKIIDVGCGGGLLSEPLARLGATVTGLDPVQENIDIATEHASRDAEIKDRLNYVCDTVEHFSQVASGEYDAVVCSEVIEHVNNPEIFVNACVHLIKEKGSLFFTTISRTLASYLISIVGGEYIYSYIPRGTHDWNKFIKPEELAEMFQSLNYEIRQVKGVAYNPFTKEWRWTSFTENAYFMHATKRRDDNFQPQSLNLPTPTWQGDNFAPINPFRKMAQSASV